MNEKIFEMLEEKINDIFLEIQAEEGIESGDITPIDSYVLENLTMELAETISNVIEFQKWPKLSHNRKVENMKYRKRESENLTIKTIGEIAEEYLKESSGKIDGFEEYLKENWIEYRTNDELMYTVAEWIGLTDFLNETAEEMEETARRLGYGTAESKVIGAALAIVGNIYNCAE